MQAVVYGESGINLISWVWGIFLADLESPQHRYLYNSLLRAFLDGDILWGNVTLESNLNSSSVNCIVLNDKFGELLK